ncbi:HAD-IIA family hydrolase [Halalkalibacter urbisdiaboli]|uniref:HAD-IIA family hydrolase n=1 Tax=Halalkalibacter urbisdiaboli TaxID=1960589 RepID=UPI000B436E58|nr:HAD-IIA family hydrolase [Halalkalibacter urbisdiaboli]
MFSNIDGFLIDIDGTIMKGNQLIPGAEKAISYLKSQNKKIVLLSNRGNISRKTCHKKLINAGVDIEANEILLASTVSACFIKKHYPSCKVWVLSDPGLREELVEHDVILAEFPEEADFLLVSLYETMTYQELNNAFKAVRNGARMIATNADKTYPTEDGHAIDVAGMIGAIEAATGRKTEIVIGKPSCFMVEAALELIQLQAENCMIIGDSPESDISLGNMHGISTTLVLTGNTTKEQVDTLVGRRKPHIIIESLANLQSLLEGK